MVLARQSFANPGMTGSAVGVDEMSAVLVLSGVVRFGWGVVLIAGLLFAGAVWASSGRVPSFRLRADEAQVDLARAAPERLARLHAARIPGRKGAWNALVAAQDTNRVKAQIRARKRRNRFLAWSLVVAFFLVAASLLSVVALYAEVAQTGVLSASMTVRLVGLTLILIFAWYGVPMLTLWACERIERARMPFGWRLLARSGVVRTLSSPLENRWIGQENPRDGHVTVPTATRMLREIEAEVIISFANRRRSEPSADLAWRRYEAPRLSRVLDAKARLLAQSPGEVRVEEIYDWIDLVVDELVNRKTKPRALAATPTTAELVEPAYRVRARRVLWLGFWRSPAGLFSSMLAVLLMLIGVGSFYPELRAALDPHPEVWVESGRLIEVVLNASATSAIAAIVTASVTKLARRR
jgi:hypothetical protein